MPFATQALPSYRWVSAWLRVSFPELNWTRVENRTEQNRTEQNWTEEVEWNGMEWNGMEWNRRHDLPLNGIYVKFIFWNLKKLIEIILSCAFIFFVDFDEILFWLMATKSATNVTIRDMYCVWIMKIWVGALKGLPLKCSMCNVGKHMLTWVSRLEVVFVDSWNCLAFISAEEFTQAAILSYHLRLQSLAPSHYDVFVLFPVLKNALLILFRISTAFSRGAI